ncbi:hypothetical protein GGR53DRAFT_499903 [Hypoxylon sp. FL1150]|nr:hypothetical protein GGR53DRAFT_499903 [Hypoxylon sp. FL1150]
MSGGAGPARRAVDFAQTNTIIQPDGRAEMHPADGLSPTTSAAVEMAEAAQAGEIPAEPEPEPTPAVDPIPPSGPPPNPPAPPAAAAAAPEPNNNNNGLPRAFSAVPPVAPPPAVAAAAAAAAAPANPGPGAPGQNFYPPVFPPIGRRAQATMPNPGAPIIIMNPGPVQPQQNMAFVNASQQQPPFLLVNPPLVAPCVPPPQPGNTGSWCYPSQSPFWPGQSHWQHTSPPSQLYVQEQGYVAEPGYVMTYPNVVQQNPAPQVQYYVNGSTGPFAYYRM